MSHNNCTYLQVVTYMKMVTNQTLSCTILKLTLWKNKINSNSQNTQGVIFCSLLEVFTVLCYASIPKQCTGRQKLHVCTYISPSARHEQMQWISRQCITRHSLQFLQHGQIACNVLAMAIPSVILSVCHTLLPYSDEQR